jgi:hypothetical protein
VPAKRYLLTVAAGLFTPFPLLVLLELIRHVAGPASPPLANSTELVAGLLFAIGVALWRPIHPWLYGALLVPGCPLAFLLWSVTSTRGNLFPLVLFFVPLSGMLIGLPAAICGWFARRWSFPAWTPAVFMVAALLVVVLGQAFQQSSADDEVPGIIGFLQQVADAEKAYTAVRPYHDYACSGTDLLTLPNVEWRANRGVGGTDLNQTQHGHYWVSLYCQPAAHSLWFTVRATPMWQGGPRLIFDSRVGSVKPETFGR